MCSISINFKVLSLHCSVLEIYRHRKPQEINKNVTAVDDTMLMGACKIPRCDFTNKPSVLYTKTGFKMIFVIALLFLSYESVSFMSPTYREELLKYPCSSMVFYFLRRKEEN